MALLFLFSIHPNQNLNGTDMNLIPDKWYVFRAEVDGMHVAVEGPFNTEVEAKIAAAERVGYYTALGSIGVK